MALKFPYGLFNFATIRQEGYFYQDRTNLIPALEAAGNQLLFLRPRRFGKSLLLSMLEQYYDLNQAGQFANLFGELAAGRNPTPLHNQYLILHWDFSLVQSQGDTTAVERALHQHVNDCIKTFMARYETVLDKAIEIQEANAISSFQSLLTAVSHAGHKLYLFIDEYDNFANEMMMGRKAQYEALMYGEGLFKTLFKAVKAAAGQALDRVFITGTSPIAMTDISSGYNIADNIYLLEEFNALCGFTEAEIKALLHRLAETADISWSPDDAFLTLKTFYNGYLFSEWAEESLYNPTLSLYFLKHLQRYGRYPKPLLDQNLAMDRHRLAYVAGLPHGEDILVQALGDSATLTIPELANRFGVEDMLKATKDHTFMVSLLYYLGVLTHAGRVAELDKLAFRIPNLVARSLYVERLREHYLPTYEDRLELETVTEALFLRGDLQPACDFLERRLLSAFSNRDYRWSNELTIKVAFMTLLNTDRIYMMASETEVDKGYADLSLIVRPDMRQSRALDLVLEFKYLSLQELGMTGVEVKAKPREECLAHPKVKEKLHEANLQAERYGDVLKNRYGLERITRFAVVALGLERIVFVAS